FSAEKINHRPVGDFSDKVQARYLHGTEDVDKLSLVPGSIPPQRGGLGTKIMFQFLLDTVQLERVLPQDYLLRGLQVCVDTYIAGNFADARDTIRGNELHDRPKRIRRMKSGRIKQRRVCNGNGGDVYLRNQRSGLTGKFIHWHRKRNWEPLNLKFLGQKSIF